jgi:hypothetical protein
VSVSTLRWILLGWSILGFLTATILDGVMMRFIIAPWLRSNERMAGGSVRLPRFLALLIERRWMRTAYHLVFATVLLAGWWYLGTPDGARWAATAMGGG